MSSIKYAVELENVKQFYKIGNNTIKALNEINLKIKQGEFLMIMGPSGSGKSTLLNTIAGLESPTEGKIKILGEELGILKDRQMCEIRRHKLGIIFQFFNLHPILTAQENVELPMLIANVKRLEREEKAKKLLELVKLSHRSNHHPHELSGGEKQRIGIARSLANDPSIILADEPTGDMDSVTGEEILSLIYTLNREYQKTIICVTHDEEMLRKGMRLLHMEDGYIVSDAYL